MGFEDTELVVWFGVQVWGTQESKHTGLIEGQVSRILVRPKLSDLTCNDHRINILQANEDMSCVHHKYEQGHYTSFWGHM